MRGKQLQQEGSVLVYSLLVLVVMSGVAFVVSSLVSREVQLSRTFDDTLGAFYAAESGVERSLDVLGEHREASALLSSTITDIENFAPAATPVLLTGSESTYVVDAAETTASPVELNIPLLRSNGGAQIELYDPDNPVSSFLSVESMQLQWNEEAACTNARQEITFYEFDSNLFTLSDDAVFKQVYACSPSAEYDCRAVTNYPAPNKNYIVRITPIDCDSIDANVTFYNLDNGEAGGGSLVPIPSRPEIAVVGSGLFSQRVMIARSKWVPSASGLVDFVLFAINPVVK